MARIKRGVTAHKRKKKVLRMAKGYYGAKSKQFRSANQSVIKSMAYAYSGRKQKKRDYRRLWIVRINAAARLNDMTYSTFINGLKLAGIDINRKMLSELAIADMDAFAELVKASKKAIGKGEKAPAKKEAPVKAAAEKTPAKQEAAEVKKATAAKAPTAAKSTSTSAKKTTAAKPAASTAAKKTTATKPAASTAAKKSTAAKSTSTAAKKTTAAKPAASTAAKKSTAPKAEKEEK